MEQENNLSDYDDAGVRAAHSVMLELVRILGEYREEIILVGGWIPSLILPQPANSSERHCGSLDVDLALNHRILPKAGYETIHRLLVGHGYKQTGEQPFQYLMRISIWNFGNNVRGMRLSRYNFYFKN